MIRIDEAIEAGAAVLGDRACPLKCAAVGSGCPALADWGHGANTPWPEVLALLLAVWPALGWHYRNRVVPQMPGSLWHGPLQAQVFVERDTFLDAISLKSHDLLMKGIVQWLRESVPQRFTGYVSPNGAYREYRCSHDGDPGYGSACYSARSFEEALEMHLERQDCGRHVSITCPQTGESR